MRLPLRESTLKTEVVEIVVIADQSILGNGVERVDHVFPDSSAANVGVLLDPTAEILVVEKVLNDHIPLGRWNSSRLPGEPFGLNNRPVENLADQDSADLGPDLTLLIQGLSRA